MSSHSSNKPLTFAAMLVRAQRRFEALGRPFPSRLMQQARSIVPPGATAACKPAALLPGAA